MSATDLGPLDWRIAITDHNGRPTPEFQRRWNTQRGNNDLIGVHLGSGAPTIAITADGEQYLDTSQNPGVLYVSSGGAWVQVGVIKFTQLKDVPNSYTGAGSKLVRVNGSANALEFASISDVLDALGSTQGDILYRSATGWVVLTPGSSGYVLTSGGAGANPSWAAATSGSPTSSNKSASFTTTSSFNTYYLDTSGGAYTVTMNATPATNEVVEVWDSTGHAGTNAISFNGNGKNISGSSTISSFINIDYGHARLIYNGVQWLAQ